MKFFSPLIILLAFILLPVQGSCQECGRIALREVSWKQIGTLVDDLHYSLLAEAVEHSLDYLAMVPDEQRFQFGPHLYSRNRLIESLRTFLDLLEEKPTASELKDELKKSYSLYQARSNDGDEELLITGYYEPLYEASFTRTDHFSYPLYKTPPDLIELAEKGGAQKKWRREKGRLLPYWTRKEIEERNLLAGHELVYLADPVDVFIIHVQGSAKLKMTDGSVRRVSYDGDNGREYSSIGRYLVDQGKMTMEEVNLPRLITYLKNHKNELATIFHHNKRFIFFKWHGSYAEGPMGSLEQAVTGGRSIALDHTCYPPGALAFIKTAKPVVDLEKDNVVAWQPLSRFVLNQDCGGAIKGPGRVDLFWGSDEYARLAAGRMKHPGTLFFLIKKSDIPSS